MGLRRVAIVGAGMTKFVRRALETPKELAYQATKQALDSCKLNLNDIDCVVHGTAPDAFDGIHMKGEYLSDASGGYQKPYMRSYVGGGTGVFAPIQGWYHIASGLFDTCLVVCEEKMSSLQPHPQSGFLTIFDHTTERPLNPNLIWIFSLEMHRYINHHGISLDDVAAVAVKNKKNALGNPYAMLGADLTIKDILGSEVLAWPVHRLMVSPVTDGAAAIILASEEKAKKLTNKPVWLEGVGWNLDSSYWTNRELNFPRYVENAARMAYNMAGIREPSKEINIAEPYDPFAYKELHHLEGLLLCPRGQAGKMTASGVTQMNGNLPVCPSGGLLGVGNPIAAAGLMKVCDLFWQLRHEATGHQVPGNPKHAVAQAWGDLMQVGTVVVLGVNK